MSDAVADYATSSVGTTLEDVKRANGGIYPGFLFLRHFLSTVILLNHARVLVRGERVLPVADTAISSATATVPQFSTFLHTAMSTEIFRPLLFGLVGGFFALSGFLVAGSAARTGTVRKFLGFRALRIVPALLFEVSLSALVLGPLVTSLALSEYFTSLELYRYFGNVIGWITFWLPGVFQDNPIKGMVNANLWTLRPEFYCYAIIAVLMVGGILSHRRVVLTGIVLLTIAFSVMSLMPPEGFTTRADNTHFTNWFIVYLFFVGVVFAQYTDKIVCSPLMFVASLLLYMLGMTLRIPDAISCIFLVYCIVCIGAVRTPWFDRFFKNDYSYGIYLYGYPIAQTLVFILMTLGIFKQDAVTSLFIMAASLVLTICCSAFSWTVIEKPFLRLKRHL
jgi:peptidoglycan/LPS O-acetylase OafA/YrhL